MSVCFPMHTIMDTDADRKDNSDWINNEVFSKCLHRTKKAGLDRSQLFSERQTKSLDLSAGNLERVGCDLLPKTWYQRSRSLGLMASMTAFGKLSYPTMRVMVVLGQVTT